MFNKYHTAKIALFAAGIFLQPQCLYADDSESEKPERTIELKRRPEHTSRPTEGVSDTIEATLIGDNLLINFDEYAGQCNVTVTNTINGSSVQTSVSSAHPVVYNIGAIDTPVIITVETDASGTYEGIMMP